MQLPVGSAAEGALGVALDDAGHGGAQRPL